MTAVADFPCVIAATATDPVGQLRAAEGTSVVMVIGAALDATSAAMARAGVPAMALERAPATRINAVVAGKRTDQAAIDQAIAFLHRSPAITGQVVELN